MINYYGDFEIHVNDDSNYTLNSSDNLIEYDKIFVDSNEFHERNSKHGIKIFKNGGAISSAIVCESGGGTTVHKNSFITIEDIIFICCGEAVYAMTIPNLDLKWRKRLSVVTCFGIYNIDNDLVIHGELSITRINKLGELLWEFSARDIFVNLNGHKAFEIINGLIKVVDFENYEYTLDSETGALISEGLL